MSATTASSLALDSLMEESVDPSSSGTGHGAAVKVKKTYYDELVAKGNMSSYSQDTLFHACPRKFALKKMQAATGNSERINSPTFAFGHAVGAGVAVYDDKQDLGQAIFAAFLAWDLDLFMEDTNRSGKLTGKSFYQAVWAIMLYKNFYEEETNLRDYEMVKIEGVLAVDFEDGHYYVGHIDEVLRNKYTGNFLVKENKTTALNVIDPCMFSNSDQALSYAVVIDMLGGSEYAVLYTIYSSSKQEWVQLEFVKTTQKKAEWIQDQLLMHQHRDDYAAAGFWPKRGGSCFSYMRRCEYFSDCDISLECRYGKGIAGLDKVMSFQSIEDIEAIDFPTTLTAIVNRQKEKLHE